MTFSLRRKRRTTRPPARSTPTAITISLLAGWLLAAGVARGQDVITAVHWQPAGTARDMPAPAPVIRPASFQPKSQADRGEAVAQAAQPGPAAGDSARYPQAREPLRSATNPLATRKFGPEEETDLTIQTELPGLDRLTRRESEPQFFERIRQESRRRPTSARVYFPDEEPISNDTYTPRSFPRLVHLVEPVFVCHGRLYFEQPNFERYGWDLGPMQPAVNLAIFYYDIIMLPYHCGTDPCHKYECNAGKCLPGDPTPLLLYREKLSITGLAAESATILGGFFAFP
jgi:hypothetical protein